MQNLIQEFQQTKMREEHHLLVLDNLPYNATVDQIQKILALRKITYEKVTIYEAANSIQFDPQGNLSCEIEFKTKQDLVKLANEVVNKQCIKLHSNILKMRILKDKANFNPTSSIFVGQLHRQCSEQDLIQEINSIFMNNKFYRKEIQKWDINQAKKKGIKLPEETIYPYFVLSCMIFAHQKTGLSKCFAFIDFD